MTRAARIGDVVDDGFNGGPRRELNLIEQFNCGLCPASIVGLGTEDRMEDAQTRDILITIRNRAGPFETRAKIMTNKARVPTRPTALGEDSDSLVVFIQFGVLPIHFLIPIDLEAQCIVVRGLHRQELFHDALRDALFHGAEQARGKRSAHAVGARRLE